MKCVTCFFPVARIVSGGFFRVTHDYTNWVLMKKMAQLPQED